MHHQDLSIDELLRNESFTNYCRGRNEADVRYWNDYIRQHPEQKERIGEALRQYTLLFNTLAEIDLEEQLQRLKGRVENPGAQIIPFTDKPRNTRSGLLRGTGIAAAVLLLFAAGWLLIRHRPVATALPADAVYSSSPGEKRVFQLSDGTQVTMNAGSTISLNTAYGQTTREVFLKGEALFDVRQNKRVPFIVHTDDMDVRALGTAFNIRSYEGDRASETTLIRGLVEITLKYYNNKKVILHPDEKLAAPPSAPVPEQPQIRPVKKMDDGGVQEVAWVENNLVFDDEDFVQIAARLERWYGIKVNFSSDEVKTYHFTATFKKEKIERVLEILRSSKEFNYDLDDNQNGRTLTIHK